MGGPVPFLTHIILGCQAAGSPLLHANLSFSLFRVALRECPWAGSEPGRP